MKIMAIRSIERIGSARELGDYILRERKRLSSSRPRKGIALMHRYSNLADAAVEGIFRLAVEETARNAGELRSEVLDGVCLVATGGYGRRELSAFSDIDLTFVTSDDDDPQIDQLVKCAYRLVMDVFLNEAGLKVGYAYRQPGDVHDLPLDAHTALLDARRVAGSALLFDRFYAAARQAVVPAPFVLGHIEQRSLASERWGASPFRIEPNIKEGVGGLRDLQTTRWIAQVAFSATRADVWHVLRARGVLTDGDVDHLEAAMEFMSRVRNALHQAAGRELDTLSVDRQEEIAQILGYTHGGRSLMAQYFVHAEHISSVYRKVTLACREHPLEIEPGMIAECGEIGIVDKGLFARDPESPVRIFEHAMTLDLSLSRQTQGLILEHVSVRWRGRKEAANRAQASKAFLRLLSCSDAAKALQPMSDTGILRWLMPEFGELMFHMPDDAAHDLTVGAHSLEAAKILGSEMSDGELCDVFESVRQPEVLLLAALLHDIGKAESDGDHPEVGAVKARDIGERLGLRPQAVETLEFLVRHHLIMSQTSRLRDLTEKRTVDDLIKVVDTPDLLDMLYLLTVADVAAVGQSTWSEVQMRFLRELYHRAATVLHSNGGISADLDRHRGRLTRELCLAHLPAAEVEEHISTMPASYLLNTPPDDLAAHIADVRRARVGEPVVRVEDDPVSRLTMLTVCILDEPEPGLLAKITGALFALDVDIHGAQVYTRESHDRIAIDLLYVDCERRPLSELKRIQVQTELRKVLACETELDGLFSRFGKKLIGHLCVTDVQVISHVSDQHTVIETEAEDQPGLLYCLTKAISSLGWDIHSARVNTWGTRARDAFYVTDSSGAKLNERHALAALRAIALPKH